ncbi:C4-dicarboxylate transporter DcuC [uncultured Veillonella sp.]|uniref:C4-dicarboxylate transporter DcuC n=1 Tax=uncultured Veillonella sp. TaxID=159268 RepID=UPI002618BC63|nr:C4-dicarboxylate transporter DcuC [uncultured Veillonella sp.]
MNILITLIVMIVVGYAIIKKVKPQTILVMGGIFLMVLAFLMGYKTSFITGKMVSTGSPMFDMFGYIKYTLASDISTIGLSIMCGAGFAKYMDHIGASARLVKISLNPLQKLHSPYLINALGFAVCMLMSLTIQSASALSMLTMVTIYPIITRLGVSKVAATSAIATGHLLDCGPAAATSQVVERLSHYGINKFFVEHQLPVYFIALVAVTITHFFWQKYMDKREGIVAGEEGSVDHDKIKGDVATPPGPWIYAILPCVPLALIIIYSEYVYKSIKIDIIVAMLISFAVAMICEFIRYRDFKKVSKSIEVFFKGMGNMFAVTVSLIVAAEVFAYGIKSMNFVSDIVGITQTAGFGLTPITIGMGVLIALVSAVTGSGVAAFVSFASLIPGFVEGFGGNMIVILQLLQNVASLSRLISPVAAVIVIVAGISGVSPVAIVKRNSVPVLVGFIVSTISVLIMF